MANKALGVDIKLSGILSWADGETGDIRTTCTNDLSLIDDTDVVKQALIKRLNTRKGQLWAHPDYGSWVWDILSDPMSDIWLMEATAAIRECINDEPRAEVIKVSYETTPQDRTVNFNISYKIVADGRQENLVFTYNPEAVENSV